MPMKVHYSRPISRRDVAWDMGKEDVVRYQHRMVIDSIESGIIIEADLSAVMVSHDKLDLAIQLADKLPDVLFSA